MYESVSVVCVQLCVWRGNAELCPLLCSQCAFHVICRKATASGQGLPWSGHHCPSDQGEDRQEESRPGVYRAPCPTTHAHPQSGWKSHRLENKFAASEVKHDRIQEAV